MKSKNFFFFVFIFFINTNIHVYSEDYGYIAIDFGSEVQFATDFENQNIELKCSSLSCNMSFKNEPKDFYEIFYSPFNNSEKIEIINLINLKFIPKNLSGMFKNLIGLKEIKGLSKLNTSEVTNMANMFYGCLSLSSIDISNFDTSSVTDMSSMFAICSSLSSIDVSNFDTSLVTNMKYMFYDVVSEIINVTNLNTSLVESMSSMFAKNYGYLNMALLGDLNATEQKIIGLTDFDTSNVRDMSNMFICSIGLINLDLSSFNTSLVEGMDLMFYGCINLISLDISNFYFKAFFSYYLFYEVRLKYINIYNVAFNNDSEYSEFLAILIESNLYLGNINDGLMVCQKENIIKGDNVTNRCCSFDVIRLICLNYLKVQYGKKTEYKNGFIYDDKGDKNIYRNNIYYILNGQDRVTIEESFTITAGSEIRIYFNESQKSIEHFFDSKYDPNVENIIFIDLSYLLSENLTQTNSLFKGCISLKSINLAFQNKLSFTSMDSMFSGCSSLESIDCSHIGTSSVTNFDYLFSGCGLIKKIDLSHFDVISLTSMNSMFKNCYSLEEIILPEFNSNNTVDSSFMFFGCSSLKSLKISVFKKLIISKIESMFSGCNSIQLLNFSEINTSLVTNMSHMFEGCSSLKNIYLNNFETLKVIDMNSMFAGCSELKAINISHFRTTSLTDMSKMFYDCKKLEKINLSNFDTKLVKYMDQLFYNCSALKILDIKNFDLTNCESYNDIFTGINNILYIDLMNLKKGKKEENIWESLNQNETFYICQTETIIINPYAYLCCEFMTNPSNCGYIPPTTLMNIQTTVIPPIITTFPKPVITTTIIPPIITTFLKPVITTFPKPLITTQLMNNNKEENSPIITTSKPRTNVDLILFSINGFMILNVVYTFSINIIIKTPNYTISIAITITVSLYYAVGLRRLEEKKIICTLQENGNSPIKKYLCEIKADNLNIENIQLKNIDFNSQDNITLAISPIAKIFLNNIQEAKDQYDFLLNKQIYILEHCIMNRYKKKLLNISGEIQDSQPSLKNMDMLLIVNPLSENDSLTEINCTFTDINGKNYLINCQIPDDMEGDFQSAISFSDDNLFILYFDSSNESIIEDMEMQGGIRYNINKKNGKITVGAILAIVLVSVACIGALVAVFIILRKKNYKSYEQQDSNLTFKIRT